MWGGCVPPLKRWFFVDLVVILFDFGVILLGSLLGGAAINLFIHGSLAFRISSLERERQGRKGQMQRMETLGDNEAELVAAIGEAAQMHSEGKQIPEIIKEISLKHPSVAMRLIKDFMSGKLKLPSGGGKGLFG